MEYIAPEPGIHGKILCCECGIAIDPNPSNKCLGCIRSKNDITDTIPKTASMMFCRECERYLDPPALWITAGLESKELLRLCLKKIKGLTLVRLVDAGFIWTEPHSKRIKVKLVVQKEIITGTVLQQEFVVEFTIQNLMCNDCHKVEAKDFWNAVIQVRQKTDHKRTFYYLEQRILKHRIHDKTLGIKSVTGGLDFYFATEQPANHMLDFLQSAVPCRWTRSKKLKSHDIRSNIYNYKHSYSVEIVPICKDSIVCLPSNIAHNCGGIGRICIVRKVTSMLQVIDPTTAQLSEIRAPVFFQTPFRALCTSRKLVEFIVIDVNDADVKSFVGQGRISSRHKVCEAWVQRASELGTSDTMFVRSHLGGILKIGDSVYGFDIRNSNLNDENLDGMDITELPDVILVKKKYGDKSFRNKRRKWKLRHLDLINDDKTSQNRDYMDFLEDLEEDPDIRSNVNIYKNLEKQTTESEIDDDEMPTVGVEEMLDDLQVDAEPDEEEQDNLQVDAQPDEEEQKDDLQIDAQPDEENE